MWQNARLVLAWIGVVALLPWATFFVTVRAVRADSNLVGALVLSGYLALDIVFALYLGGWPASGAWQVVLLVLGLMCAAVYNFVVCDFIAERAGDSS
jgi:hypothetical protein